MLKWISRNQPDIISIHIPKTGGTSFWRVMEHVYGPDSVQRIFPKDYEDGQKVEIHRGVRAIHGHLRYAELESRLSLGPGLRVVTWLRNPVDRVISNYHYRVEQEELSEIGLLRYASRLPARNRMSKYLEGADLEKLFFVGILESFWEDCNELRQRLGWREFPHFWENMTEYRRKEVGEDVRREISGLNEQDELLYAQALQLRAARQSRVGQEC